MCQNRICCCLDGTLFFSFKNISKVEGMDRELWPELKDVQINSYAGSERPFSSCLIYLPNFPPLVASFAGCKTYTSATALAHSKAQDKVAFCISSNILYPHCHCCLFKICCNQCLCSAIYREESTRCCTRVLDN